MRIQFTLAMRYLAGRKLRTALTTVAIVFGVMLLFGLNGILPAVMESLQRSMIAAAGETDVTVSSKSNNNFDSKIAEKVADVEGIGAATPILRKAILVPDALDVNTVTLTGVDPETVISVRPYPVQNGRMLDAEDAQRDARAMLTGDRSWSSVAVLPAATAEDLGLRVGDTVEFPSALGTTEVTIVGVLDIVAIPGQSEVYVTLPAAQAILGTGDRISSVEAVREPGAEKAAVEDTVKRAVGQSYRVGALSTDTSLFASMQMGVFIINMFGVLALVMAGFIILNTFRTVVAERRHDIGMLRAIGASRRTILGLFLTESMLQGVIGTAIGIAAGYWLASAAMSGMRYLYEDLLHLSVGEPVFTWQTWALAIGLGVGVTVLSAVIPARAAARISPLDALRPQMGDVYEKMVTRRALVGVAIIGVAAIGLLTRNSSLVGFSAVVFLIGLVLATPALVKPVTDAFSRAIDLVFAREGGIARANLQRNVGRAAVTASAMMVSVAIIIALLGTITSIFTGFMDYVDKSLGADFLVIPSNMLLQTGTVAAGPQLFDQVTDTRGIGDVATLRVAQAGLGDGTLQVIGIDPVAYPKVASFTFSEGSSESDIRLLARDGTIMVNGIFAAQNGLKKGDDLTLDTPAGRRTYKVSAVGSDYLNAKLATTYVSQDALERDFGVTADVLLMANAEQGSDPGAVYRELNDVIREYPSFALYDTETWRDLQVNTFDQTRGAMYFMLVILAAPSLLALINTLAISVLARTREIGMLRAIGTTRKQVRRMVIAESLLLASLGTVLGMVAGVWLGYSMTDAMNTAGFTIPYYFPWDGLIAATIIGVVFGVLAALIPARQATKLSVIEALRWE